VKANATDLPQPAPVTAAAPAEAVTALYRAHALGLIRLVIDLLWSDAPGRVLIGVIRAGGRNWVGVISGNKFTPLNARWTLTTTQGLTDFGTW
jgi:hypothetical protein